jgi:glycosyltransferase involved in cell wall biosynthesis
VEHVEVWEHGKLIDDGPTHKVESNRTLGELTFWMSNFLLLRRFWKYFSPQKADVVVASAYSFTMLAILLRRLGRVRKVVCTIVDYLPPAGSFHVRLHRRMTTAITCWVARHSDEVWTISPRIVTGDANPHTYVMQFPVDNFHAPPGVRTEIGYIGFPSPDHALELLFEVCKRQKLKLNIIGDSPYLQSIKHLAPADTVFHGITSDQAKINAVLARCFCGYCVYRSIGPDNYSYYGFPSKAIHWFANNTPVVTTQTSHFTQQIETLGIGHVVAPVLEEVEKAVMDLKVNSAAYYDAINRFRDQWNGEMETFQLERFTALLTGK